MKHAFFAYIARMRYIRRWALMRNSETENIQEHSHMTAVLAHALALIENRCFGGHLDADRIAVQALYHDATEILTGDMPTPIKYANPVIRESYRAVEDTATEHLLATLPEDFRDAYAPLLAAEGENERIIKAADKLSAHIKCLEERKAGNLEFRKAEEQTLAALKSYRMPALDYFMEHFLDAFLLTLDELD